MFIEIEYNHMYFACNLLFAITCRLRYGSLSATCDKYRVGIKERTIPCFKVLETMSCLQPEHSSGKAASKTMCETHIRCDLEMQGHLCKL
jgi:hypothetical protein